MKILQINAVYGHKSTGVIVKDVEDTLVRHGHQPFCAYQECSVMPKNGYKVGNVLDEKLHAVSARVWGRQGYASRRETKKLVRWIQSVRPDVVHLHNLHSNYIHFNTLTEYLAEANIPTVITLHDCWYFTGKCSHYVPYGCTRWQTSCGDCPALKTEVRSLFFDNTSKVLLDRTAHINDIENVTLVGCSLWIADEARRSLIGGNKIEVVYNGVDTDVFTPHDSDFRKNYGIGADEFVVLGMANKWCQPANVQGVRSIIQAAPDVRFVIVGEDKTPYDDCENVTAISYLSGRSALSDAYAAGDVFVNLTHADTLPTVNMESLCCGTPVITFDVGGCAELLAEGDGVVVAENDFDAVSRAIEAVKKSRMRADAARAKQRFDKETCYEKYLEIYRQATGADK